MDEMTPEQYKAKQQAYFDKVAVHLMTQGKKAQITLKEGDKDWVQTGEESDSHSYNTYCMYRAPNPDDPSHPLSCAAGCAIPDELYDPAMENRTINMVIHSYPKLRPYFPDLELATRLQHLHDSYNVESWYNELQYVANGFNLNTTTLEQYKSKEQ